MDQNDRQEARTGAVELLSFAMAAPDDTSGLANALSSGLSTHDVLAVFAKTEGNGLDNDWSRTLAHRAISDALAGAQVPMIIVSGGCEGFTTPHMLVAVLRATPSPAPTTRFLAAAFARSRPLEAHEIGTAAQIDATASTVRLLSDALGIEPAGLAYVHAVTPVVEPAPGDDMAARDGTAAHRSKPSSRAATALGAAHAINGIALERARTALRDGDRQVFGDRCVATAGSTAGRVELLAFAEVRSLANPNPTPAARPSTVRQGLACRVIRDLLDLGPLRDLASSSTIAAVLAKVDLPAGARLRGERLGFERDGDIHAFRHLRAAMSGAIAASTGSTRSFIGAGAEHQCPPNGALITVVTTEPNNP